MSDDGRVMDLGVTARFDNASRMGMGGIGTIAAPADQDRLDIRALSAGAEAGGAAGAVMGLLAIIVSIGHGLGLWTPFNDVASLITFPVASATDFSPYRLIVGFGVHFTIAILLGVFFASIYSGVLKPGFHLGVSLPFGVAFGLLAWLMAQRVLLPALHSEIYSAPEFMTAHVIFGAVLGLVYPLMVARRV